MQALFEALPKEFVSGTSFVDYKTPVTEVLENIRRLGAVVVLKNRQYYGIVDDRSVSRSRSLQPLKFSKSFPIGKLARKLPPLGPETSLSKLIADFHESSAKVLPYMQGGKITGIVRRSVVLSTILSLHMLSKLKVADVMSAPVVSIAPGANLAQAISTMSKSNIARLAVVDKGPAPGILTAQDITDNLTKPEERMPEKKSRGFSPANIQVSSVMRSPAYTISHDRPAEDAIKGLLEKHISSLIVTKADKAVGMVTVSDILENAAALTARTRSNVIVSGLDEYTKDYEQQIRNEAERLVSRIDRFQGLQADYVSLNIKRHRERNYEAHARLALKQKGTVFAHAYGYSVESVVSSLIESIYDRVKERKEEFISSKRGAERYYGEKE